MDRQTTDREPTALQRWVRQPQRVWLRRAVFQVHLWSGISLGLYVVFISLTGSVLVYRNELYAAAATQSDMRLVAALIDLHADLLGGPTGRRLNGIGALAVLLSGITGLFIWWPGAKRWRRSLALKRGVNWKRSNWDLHSAVGIWSVGFILIFAVSGIYLAFPGPFQELADLLDGGAEANGGAFFFNDFLARLAYSHFGRINGIGIGCSGPGLCDQAVKAVWALFGLAPTAMFATGSIMWWNRVVRPWRRRTSTERTRPGAR
jgi:uncharacterized iron-regulated membrane protein